MLAVKGPTRAAHLRSKSSSRARGTDNQSERDVRGPRINTKRTTSTDVKDDAATTAFVRRVLCAGQISTSQPLEEILPPLTSSNEVDLQLYAIIAVIIKDFVQAWYARITPDHEFVDEVVQIIAHCTRGLEQRLRRVDLESLLLDEIPQLLIDHADALRTAEGQANSPGGLLFGNDRRTIYHTMHPHPALSPVPGNPDSPTAVEQRANEAAWRQLLIEGVLVNLLPPEDLRNPCLLALVQEIFSEMILGNVLGNKLSQGWFLWDAITKAIVAVRPMPVESPDEKKASRLDQYGLLSAQPSSRDPPRRRRRGHSVYALIINIGWEILRITVLVMGTARTLLTHLNDAAQLPSRLLRSDSSVPSSPAVPASEIGMVAIIPAADLKAPVIDLAAWRVPLHVLDLNGSVPWLVGILSLVKYYALWGPRRVGALDTRLDRLLSHTLSSRLLNPSLLPTLLRTTRAALFPNNSLGPAVPPPTDVLGVRRRCAMTILSLVPSAVRSLHLDPDPARAATLIEERSLVLFEDSYLNKHLLFAVVEVVLCRAFPEIEVSPTTKSPPEPASD